MLHRDAWQQARQLVNDDNWATQQNMELEILSFDLEEALPLLRLPTGMTFQKAAMAVLRRNPIHSRRDKVIATFRPMKLK